MTHATLPLSGAEAQNPVTVRETGPLGMLSLRGDLADPAIAAALEAITTVPMPRPLTGAGTAQDGLLWMAPDDLGLFLPRDAAPEVAERLARALSGRHALVADVSDARAHFTLTGPPGALRDALAKCAPVDFAPDAAPVGTFRRTQLGQVAAGIWITAPDSAHVFSFRSVARYTFDLLAHATDGDAMVGYF